MRAGAASRRLQSPRPVHTVGGYFGAHPLFGPVIELNEDPQQVTGLDVPTPGSYLLMARVGAFDPDDDVTVPVPASCRGRCHLMAEVIDLDLDVDNTTFLAAAVFTAGGMCRSIVETSPPRPRHAGHGQRLRG